MTTTNGHDPLEAAVQAESESAADRHSSTVLALDGWGAVQPASTTNGATPELDYQPAEPEAELSTATGPRAPTRGSIFGPSLVRIGAPLAAMALAVIVAIRFGSQLRERLLTPTPTPEPLVGLTLIRRQIALAIDPSLTPTPPRRRRWKPWT